MPSSKRHHHIGTRARAVHHSALSRDQSFIVLRYLKGKSKYRQERALKPARNKERSENNQQHRTFRRPRRKHSVCNNNSCTEPGRLTWTQTRLSSGRRSCRHPGSRCVAHSKYTHTAHSFPLTLTLLFCRWNTRGTPLGAVHHCLLSLSLTTPQQFKTSLYSIPRTVHHLTSRFHPPHARRHEPARAPFRSFRLLP